ncbi:UvrD-helicase domain-containing protein [Amycolatopsis sp. NPDC057786]|uniref:UvrD-helicase domain-containing protein n=1 Tax=Amycolatopsis sp. NPDC057786 TaxID=3346250 RepID=UPI0036715278
MRLDDTRKQILAASGHLLIQGGPGSGKTTIALLKAAQTLETLAAEQHVVFLSFSRAAVRQISDRVGEHLPLAIRPLLEVRTFHAFFLDLVRAHSPLLTGTSAEFLAPDAERQRQADHDGDWDSETIALANRGIFVFDQLAATAATLLERSSALRALYSDRYPLVIVDEFQDTNVDQWRVVQALADKSTVICLADPDQRIYEGFVKGVDEERLHHAVTALQPTPFDLAGGNHRSPGNGILDYANAVLRNSPAEQPSSVQYVRYSYPYTPEAVTHHVVLRLQAMLAEQLGREPTIVVLGPSSAFVASISEAISAEQSINGTQLPAVDHELVWDPVLAAAAGYVVASILEWPTLSRDEAVTFTLHRIADFYRVKFTDKQAETARSAIKTTNNAIKAFGLGKTPLSKTGKLVIEEADKGIQLTGNPVTDWQLARARLRGSKELREIFDKARMLRLLHATDALAWGLTDAWDGQASYPGAAEIVRRVLAEELIDGRPAEPRAVTLMNMHKSKGKEFDGVVIAEGLYTPKLVDPDWSDKRIVQQRRVIRVAITRARHRVFFVRPKNAIPLVPPKGNRPQG